MLYLSSVHIVTLLMSLQDLSVVGLSVASGTSVSEALSKPVGTVRTQSLSESMVNTPPSIQLSKSSKSQCIVS